MTLTTSHVFLTGGAQGLGKSYIDGLLALGAKVFFGDINSTVGEATEKEFQEKYGTDRVKFFAFDCTDDPKFEEAFAAAVDFLGHVDLMVNNAGMMNESKYAQMIQLNFTAIVKGTSLAAEHMRRDKGGKGGRIINISSIAGLQEYEIIPVYTGTKHAVRAFTSSLAMAPDIQQQGIEYGILCPSPAATDMILKIDHHKVRHIDTLVPGALDSTMASVERIQQGFLKLVCLEKLNGAILYTSKTEMTFQRVDRVTLGESWPLEKTEESKQE